MLLPNRSTVLATLVLGLLASVGSFVARPASVQVNGRKIATDVAPITQARHAYVPLRAVAHGLGATTTFDRSSGTIEVIRGDDTLRLRVGKKTATVNGREIALSSPPFTSHGRVMVGLQTLGQAFGTATHYDGARGKIDVISPGMLEAAPVNP